MPAPKPFKRQGSPFYQYDFVIDGRRFHGSTKCVSKADAQRIITRVYRAAILGSDTKPTINLDEACGTWWRDIGRHSPSNGTYKTQIKFLMAGLGAQTRIDEIGQGELTNYVARRRHGKSNATVNRDIELLRRIWSHMADQGFEAQSIKWGKLKLREPKGRVRELGDGEQARLFAALPDNLKPVVMFALMSGKRRSEIIELAWSDVDFTRAEAKFRVKGGGFHTIPLTTAMVALIANQPKVCPQVFTYVCERSTGRHGIGRRKGERYPFSKQGWQRQWRAALQAAGVDDFRFHDLRHTAATRLLRETGNLELVRQVLGHADIGTTTRYAHADRDDQRAGMEKVERRK